MLFDRATQVRHKDDIILFSMMRSGGTQILQVFYCLLHGSPKFHEKCVKMNLPGEKMVVVYRDFRDVLASWYRVEGRTGEPDLPLKDRFGISMKRTLDSIEELDKCRKMYGGKSNKTILWLKYENFYRNYDYLFGVLEDFLEVKISDEIRRKIIKRTDINANLKRMKENEKNHPLSKDGFWEYRNRENGVHNKHINLKYKGKPGSWEYIIPEEFHKEMYKILTSHLKKWNYLKNI